MLALNLFSLTLLAFVALTCLNHVLGQARIAKLTYYHAYPLCCPDNPHHNPNADTSECGDYSVCDSFVNFTGIGRQPLSYLQSNSLISFYDDADPNGLNFTSKYKYFKTYLTIKCGGMTLTSGYLIADTCHNDRCDDCCRKKAHENTGLLVAIEYSTAMRNFRTTDCLNESPSSREGVSSSSKCSSFQACNFLPLFISVFVIFLPFL